MRASEAGGSGLRAKLVMTYAGLAAAVGAFSCLAPRMMGAPLVLLGVGLGLLVGGWMSRSTHLELRGISEEFVLVQRGLEARLAEHEEARRRLEQEAEGRERRERATRRARKMQAVGRLASGMARDQSDVFSIILGYAGMALDGLPSGDPLFGPLTEIKRAAERSVEQTRRLLVLGRSHVEDTKTHDLSTLVERMSRSIQRVLGDERELSLSCEAMPCPVRGSRADVEQLVMNLVSNARDAMPRGGTLRLEIGMVDVSAAEAAREVGLSPGRQVRMRVSDTGVGMSPEVQERIFEPFFTTKGDASAGLGLAAVYGFLQQRGGHVRVESEVGRGTSLEVLLPEPTPIPESKQLPSSGATRAARTILVVEDEEQVRLVMERILRRHRYGVLVAGSPDEAVSICREHPGRIDLLVTDVGVAETNGQALADRLLERHPEMKVLFVSGHLRETVLSADGVQEKAFLQKPVTPEALRQKVRGILKSVSIPPSHRGTA
jgi:two-component system cell cycle sensor histidine kinase/response regulator CckA